MNELIDLVGDRPQRFQVCADGAPAWLVVDGCDESFIGEDGAPITPTSWVPGPCPTTCEEVFTREPWHSQVLTGEPVRIGYTTVDYTLPESIANAVNATSDPTNPSGLMRWMPKATMGGSFVGGGSWAEPGVAGSVATNPAGWYDYSGPTTPILPHLWPYAAARITVAVDPSCAPPPAVDVTVSFRWRYDGPKQLPIGVSGDTAIIAWLIDTTGPTVVSQTVVLESTITSIGQTDTVTLNAAGLTVAQASNLALVVAVNTAEGGGQPGDYIAGAALGRKDTGYTVSRLTIDIQGEAQCPECQTVWRETTCDGVRWVDANDNVVPPLSDASAGLCPSPVSFVEIGCVGGSTPVEIVKTVGADGSLVVTGVFAHDPVTGEPVPLPAPWPGLRSGACHPAAPNVVSERAVCVDTGTGIVEAFLVIGRSPVTGEITWTRIEDSAGTALTGSIIECDCAPNTPILEARNTYTGGSIQSNFTDKWGADCGPVTWTVEAFQNGSLVYTSPTSPALTSATAAQTWLNTTGGGGYITLNAYNDAPNGNPTVNRWSLPAQSTGEWLIVITENAGNQCVPIAYGFANYDIQNNGNASPTGWWDTIGPIGLNPTNGPVNYPWQIG